MATVTYAYVATMPEFVANTVFEEVDQVDPDLVVLDDGGFVVVYTSNNAGSGQDIAYQSYHANGAKNQGSGWFPPGAQRNLATAATSDGGFVIAAENVNASGSGGSSVFWKKNELPSNSPQIAGDEADDQIAPAVAGLTGDRFVVVWADENSGDSSNFNIRMSVYNNAGTVTVNNAVNVANTSGSERLPSVAPTSTGGFVVAWSDDGADSTATRILAQRYDSEGNKLGVAIVVDDTGDNDRSDVIGLSDGGFAVAWHGADSGSANDVRLRIYNANGTPRTGALGVNTGSASSTDPSIAELSNGFITVSWTANVSASNNDLYVRTFTADGVAVTGQVRYQGTSNDAINQRESAIDSMDGGRFAAAWTDGEVLDGGGSHIAAAIYALRRTTTGNDTGEILFGDALQDVINGQGGQDIISGLAADDQLNGEGGDDLMGGGAGADILDGGLGSDTADYSGNDEVLVIFLNGNVNATAFVGGDAEDTLRNIENVTGGTGNDTLVGDGFANLLRGGLGDDYLFSNGFNPDGTMKAGAGNDTLNGEGGNDGLFGGDGEDVLNGGDGDDGMVGGADDDLMNGGAGVDFLFGGAFGPGGAQLANSGNDILNGGDGNDGLYGFDGADLIRGDGDNDYVEGGAGNDVINGGAGSDYLLGQDDADTINGGLGFDYLYGGLGADTFVFRKGDSADWILDFSAAQGDKLRFLEFGYANFLAIPLVDLSTSGNPAVQLTFIEGANVDQLTIFGATLAQLNATNVLVA